MIPQVLHKAFACWLETIRSRERKSALVQRAAAVWRMRTAAAAFALWAEHTDAACAAKQAAAHAVAHWQHGLAATAWDAWLAKAEAWRLKRSCVATAEEHRRHVVAATSFSAWRDGHDASLADRQRMEKAVRFLRSSRLAAGWRSWLATTQQKQVRDCLSSHNTYLCGRGDCCALRPRLRSV